MNTQFNFAAVKRFNNLFSAILAVLPTARIGGGFIRDLLLNKQTKDIDIFTDRDVLPSELAALERILQLAPGGLEDTDLTEARTDGELVAEYVGDYDNRLSKIRKLYKGNGVDLLIVTNVETHFNEFPDAASRVWVQRDSQDGEPTLGFGDGFAESHEQKIIEYRYEGHDDRVARLRAKFPDYTLIVAGEFVA